MKGWFNVQTSINIIISLMYKQKKKNHTNRINRSQKAFDKIKQPFMIKTPSKLRREGNFLNLIKNIYKNHMANIILNGEKNQRFPAKTRNTARMSHLTNVFATSYCNFKLMH